MKLVEIKGGATDDSDGMTSALGSEIATVLNEDWKEFEREVILAVFEGSRDSSVSLEARLENDYPADTVIGSPNADALFRAGEEVTRKRIESTIAHLDALVEDFAADSWETVKEAVNVHHPEQNPKFASTVGPKLDDRTYSRSVPERSDERDAGYRLGNIVDLIRKNKNLAFELEIPKYVLHQETSFRRWTEDALKSVERILESAVPNLATEADDFQDSPL